MKKKFRVTYNAPVTLTFAIMCVLILLMNDFLLGKHLIPALFTAPARIGTKILTESAPKNIGFNYKNAFDYFRLFLHIFGHTDWNHLLGNFAFVLLLGPLMEERYGSKMVALMFVVTAFVTGVINVCLIPHPLLGASGIVFMLIILASITTLDKNVIPLSFIFVVAIYLGRELINAPKAENISTVAHIAGGLCGSMFGFLVVPKGKRNVKKEEKNLSERSSSKSEEKTERPSFFNRREQPKEEDSTVVGTLEI
ncbi:MAG: rhomboid family intramembrane serine protease [Treponema sp.]|uniref:rhomboid family intramembrane serine protease n=1 Tax=Treponema sp. TaxID=166 RepID=UPI001B702C10|nr:rhomboid family intramembrane serine protease [Treponema sp.]MBP3773657.1 rhomboid family intramembrane serine protease [Treponema sp.]MBQ9280851.1 rhomboid family intramembrane serine protease [Treponema sp.]